MEREGNDTNEWNNMNPIFPEYVCICTSVWNLYIYTYKSERKRDIFVSPLRLTHIDSYEEASQQSWRK